MAYSAENRQRVILFVEQGGTKSEVVRLYIVNSIKFHTIKSYLKVK